MGIDELIRLRWEALEIIGLEFKYIKNILHDSHGINIIEENLKDFIGNHEIKYSSINHQEILFDLENTAYKKVSVFTIKEKNVDYIVGPEARGFIIGAAIASRLKIGFIPVRKAGKLPPSTVTRQFEYEKEYGKDKLELPKLVEENYKNKNFFFVGSAIDGTDYTSDFIENNKWKFGWESREDTDQYQLLRTYYDQMNEGDYIVLKSSYTRKIDLPFPNPNNQFASVMRIKAVGIIQENIGDGHTVKVEWIKDYRTTKKEWYFNTSRETIWMLDYNSELSSQLIEFSLNNGKQDYNYFLNIEYWRNHFFTDDQYEEYKVGQDDSPSDSNFIWIEFYQELADKLLLYSSDRQALIKKIEDTYESIGMKLPTLEKDRNIIDIDPFTIFALFNKGITDANRIKIITGFKEEFSISSDVPDSFNGIPVVNNMAATFYYFIDDREKNDIDNLWSIFTAAMKYDEQPSEESMKNFIIAFDRTLQQRGIRWNLTMGLYWIRPKRFINLDGVNRKFILNHDNLPSELIDKLNGLSKMPDG